VWLFYQQTNKQTNVLLRTIRMRSQRLWRASGVAAYTQTNKCQTNKRPNESVKHMKLNIRYVFDKKINKMN